MNEHPWSRRLIIIALPIIVGVFYFTASLHFTYTPDDTYIYLRFAKNVIQGNGISFNPGVPTYGFTSPLWLFIISLGGSMGVDLYVAAKGIDLVFASLALVVFYLLAYEMIRDSAAAICATVAFSLNAWLMRWAGTGMETSLAVFLTLATLWFCLRNEYFVAIVLAALLSLVRPEGALIVPVIIGDMYFNSVDKRRAIHMSAALALIFSVILVPWLLYAFNTFGTVLPNSAFAKAGWHPGIDQLTATGIDIIRTIGGVDGAAVVALVLAGSILIAKRKMLIAGDGIDRRLFLIRQSVVGIGWIVLVLIFYLASDANVVSRYLLLVTPMITILAFSYVHHVMLHTSMKRFSYAAVLLLAALVMVQNQLAYRRVVVPGMAAFEQGMETCLIPIGKWLNQNTPPGTKVVTGDVGAIGFFSGREICDAAGLVSPAARQLLQQGNNADDIIGRKLYESFCQPEYVIHRASLPEELKGDPALLPLLTRPFAGVSLSDPQIRYYTLYKVTSKVNQ
ncbi:MAG TPA: hypothetical protein VGR15_07865 [Bacteroidota bacterium]|nr:hypothetical protein [Bacteroidota bacterium]